jgi:hypothetical protein
VREDLRGHIASAGFASGDRFVVGSWQASPVGPLVDVMWARPDGERVLLAPSAEAATYITSVYGFDRVEVVDVAGGVAPDGRGLRVVAGPVALSLSTGWGVPLPLAPAWFVRWVEGPVARALLGVRTYGVSPTGVREWYRATSWRPVRRGSASVHGADLGALGPVDPRCGFGFSEPPVRPSIVAVRPQLERP